MDLSICPSICLPIHAPVYLSICLSTFLCPSLSIYLFVYLSTDLCTRMTTNLILTDRSVCCCTHVGFLHNICIYVYPNVYCCMYICVYVYGYKCTYVYIWAIAFLGPLGFRFRHQGTLEGYDHNGYKDRNKFQPHTHVINMKVLQVRPYLPTYMHVYVYRNSIKKRPVWFFTYHRAFCKSISFLTPLWLTMVPPASLLGAAGSLPCPCGLAKYFGLHNNLRDSCWEVAVPFPSSKYFVTPCFKNPLAVV